MSRWSIAIVSTMVVTFGLTVLSLMWERWASSPASLAPVTAGHRSEVMSGGGSVQFETESLPTVAKSPNSDRLRDIKRPASIVLSVHNQHRLDSIEGKVQNKSDAPVTVLLVSKDRDGAIADRMVINLAAGAQSSFGTEAGMVLVPGGMVVAQVAGERAEELKIGL
jgi:hypothetical protein